MDRTYRLNTGANMPVIGFGTWKLMDGDEAKNAVELALHTGYRLIDTAKIYHNETSVGQAIINSGIERKDIFVTTKLWTGDQGYQSALRAFEESLSKLNSEYIDLYLIHWPGDDINRRSESWRALIDIHSSGKAWAIGVSNFNVAQIQDLMKSSVVPAVDQIEFHPMIFQKQKPIIDFCKANDIVVEAYTPLAEGRLFDDPVVLDISRRSEKTPAQVLLRWCIQHGTIPIPKSSNAVRIRENLDVFDFELSEKDMESLNRLSNGRSTFS